MLWDLLMHFFFSSSFLDCACFMMKRIVDCLLNEINMALYALGFSSISRSLVCMVFEIVFLTLLN